MPGTMSSRMTKNSLKFIGISDFTRSGSRLSLSQSSMILDSSGVEERDLMVRFNNAWSTRSRLERE